MITGASDDDPNGIATYSQAGAQFGYMLTWTMLFSYPLMTAVQMISARLGRTTGHGIAGVLRTYYSNWLLQVIVILLLIANTINLAADLGAALHGLHGRGLAAAHGGDALGDACDPDDDNDALTDTAEATLGTNPIDSDTDDDGALDLMRPQRFGSL